jgi:hypothetical protein
MQHQILVDRRPKGAWISAGVILVLCLIVGLPTIRSDNYFLGDDFGLVHHLHKAPIGHFLAYFVSDWTEGIYGFTLDELRPLLAFTYRLDSNLFGAANAQGYHVTNVILHMLNALLVLAIARSLAPGSMWTGLLAGSLFALMPSSAEPIAWISGRVDSLASLFYLGAFLCFVRYRARRRAGWLGGTLVLFVLGLFAKQSLVTLPALLIAYDLVYGPRLKGARWKELFSQYRCHLPFFLLLILYLALRQALFGNALRENAISPGVIGRFLTERQYAYLMWLVPFAGAASATVKAAIAAVTTLALAIAGWRLYARRATHTLWVRRVFFFGPVWYAITIAPMVVTYASARHLYLTAAGLSIALASLLSPEPTEGKIRLGARRIVAVGVLLALCYASLASNVGKWITNGVESHRFVTSLPPMLEPLPRGAVVFIDIPDMSRDLWMWSFGLPFALQQPFMQDDLYGRFAIIERRDVYCCPKWWEAKQTAFTSLLSSTGPQQVAHIAPTQEGSAPLTLTMRTVTGPALKLKIEKTVGRPVDGLFSNIADAEKEKLIRTVLE